jgi:DNA-binding Xre family transcriptional regulator/molecular chaperone GrpE (heat shock protein)
MDKLLQLMQSAGISSYKELCQKAGVSEKQLRRLRRGEMPQLRLITLEKISQGLQMSLADLLELFDTSSTTNSDCAGAQLRDKPPVRYRDRQTLEREYHKLQVQLQEQRELLLAEFQQSTLQMLESWLLQWPTAAHAVKQNPQIPAERLLKLVQPIEKMLEHWGIEAIAQVGTEVPYNPQLHQLMDGTAKPGDFVKVRYAGYQQQDKLLYRAKVSPAT